MLALAVIAGLCACLPRASYVTTPPPPPHAMPAELALGAWQSSFGDVTIEADASRGGLARGALRGTWTYVAATGEVRGAFAGHLRGNVLELTWTEGALAGHGYLEFDPDGWHYAGRWWSTERATGLTDRTGVWNGWRALPSAAPEGGA
jgi:hypothetical protein